MQGCTVSDALPDASALAVVVPGKELINRWKLSKFFQLFATLSLAIIYPAQNWYHIIHSQYLQFCRHLQFFLVCFLNFSHFYVSGPIKHILMWGKVNQSIYKIQFLNYDFIYKGRKAIHSTFPKNLTPSPQGKWDYNLKTVFCIYSVWNMNVWQIWEK